VGSLDWSPAERRRLAAASRSCRCPKCGLLSDLVPPEREAAEENEASASSGGSAGTSASGGSGGSSKESSNKYADAIAQLHCHGAPSTRTTAEDEKSHSGESRSAAAEGGSVGTPTGTGTSGGGGSSGSGSSSTGAVPQREVEKHPVAPDASKSVPPAQPSSPLRPPAARNPLASDTPPRGGASGSAASRGGGNGTSVAGGGGGNVRQRSGAARASPRAERNGADSRVTVSAERRGNNATTENGLDPLLMLAWALGIAVIMLIGRKALRIFMLRFFDVPINL